MVAVSSSGAASGFDGKVPTNISSYPLKRRWASNIGTGPMDSEGVAFWGSFKRESPTRFPAGV